MRRVQAVGAVVVRRDGRVLVIRRGRPPREGEWTLPGGHVERGESLESAITRELREETGLEVTVVRFLETFILEAPDRTFAIHEHLCVPKRDDAPLVPGDDARDARWVRPADLTRLRVRAAARHVVSRAIEVWRAMRGSLT